MPLSAKVSSTTFRMVMLSSATRMDLLILCRTLQPRGCTLPLTQATTLSVEAPGLKIPFTPAACERARMSSSGMIPPRTPRCPPLPLAEQLQDPGEQVVVRPGEDGQATPSTSSWMAVCTTISGRLVEPV
jgi:hypothetical protein